MMFTVQLLQLVDVDVHDVTDHFDPEGTHFSLQRIPMTKELLARKEVERKKRLGFEFGDNVIDAEGLQVLGGFCDAIGNKTIELPVTSLRTSEILGIAHCRDCGCRWDN